MRKIGRLEEGGTTSHVRDSILKYCVWLSCEGLEYF